jgi:peptide-methionine (S)-S-oxide reductase
VVRTRVGYTGGTLADPTYYHLGDHSESVQMDYDPSQISYENLIEVFWEAHDPTSPMFSRQYMNAVFYHSEEQRQLAVGTRDRIAAELGQKVETQILPAGTFYLAEDYHQKYNLRLYDTVYQELASVYPQTADLVASSAAARLNGYLGGYGTRAQLEQELPSLGVSPEASETLLRIVRR